MTPEQATALIVALTGLIGALGVLFVQIARIRRDINGRMAELVQAARDLGMKQGELEGRDFMRRLLAPGGAIQPQREPDDPPNNDPPPPARPKGGLE